MGSSMSATHPVSVVICTYNSIASARYCLESARSEDVEEIIVVDAESTDGTRQIAQELADVVLTDQGVGLGAARNLGIEASNSKYLLILGSDNVLTPGSIAIMIASMKDSDCHGVGALTRVVGDSYLSKGLDAWRKHRFVPGPAAVVGSPTLFLGSQIRKHPFDSTRKFSDDTELCERWTREFGSCFTISEAIVLEVGKAGFQDLVTRCKIYGISDHEVFRSGLRVGWPIARRVRSILHPVKSDLVRPLRHMRFGEIIYFLPFLTLFTTMRYMFWARAALVSRADP